MDIAHDGEWVLDPFVGSGSSALACVEDGRLNYVGCELGVEIYDMAVKRASEACSQQRIFDKIEQKKIDL